MENGRTKLIVLGQIANSNFILCNGVGRLRSLGYKVTRDRVRQAIRVTDPLSIALQSLPQGVPGPNSLWHIGELQGRRQQPKSGEA